MIGKILRARKLYKDGTTFRDHPEEIMTDVAWGFFQMFSVIATLVLVGLIIITGGIGWWQDIGFLKVIAVLFAVVLVLLRILVRMAKKFIGRTMHSAVRVTKKPYTTLLILSELSVNMPKIARQTLKILAVLLLAAIFLALIFVSPSEIIEIVGVRNSYVILAIIGFFGAISTLTAASFYSTLAVFVAGGLDPVITALVVAPVITAGDLIFYSLIRLAESLIVRVEKRMHKLVQWFERRPSWMIPVITFLYFALSPISSDIFLILVSFSKTKIKRLIIPILVGNLIFFLWLGFAIVQGARIVEVFI